MMRIARASGPATVVSLPGRSAIIGAESTMRSNQRLPSWQARMPIGRAHRMAEREDRRRAVG